MKSSYSFCAILVVVSMVGLAGCISIKFSAATPTLVPTLVGPRQIAENTLGLREYWRVPLAFVGGNLVAMPGRVVYINWVKNVPHVRVLDSTNGNLLWEVAASSGAGWMAAGAEQVYFEDTYRVLHAYAMKDGRLLWERQLTLGRRHSFDPHGDILYLQQGGSGEDLLYTLDARTGEILNTESLWTADHFLVFARFPQIGLHILTVQSPFTLRAVDPVTQRTLWQVKQGPNLFLMNLRWPPTLLDDLLLLDVEGEVLALDAHSGKIRILWALLHPFHDLCPLLQR